MGKLNFCNCHEKCVMIKLLWRTKSWYISIDCILPTTQGGKHCSPHRFNFYFNWDSERLSNLPPKSPKLKATDWDLTRICPVPKQMFSLLHDSVIFSLWYMRVPCKLGHRRDPGGPEDMEGRKEEDGEGLDYIIHSSCTLEQVSQPQHTDIWGTIIFVIEGVENSLCDIG